VKTILAMTTAAIIATTASAEDTRCFEMRVYFAAPGKLDELHARFRNHTCKLFEKHGMTNLGYFVPVENPDSRLIYFLAFPSRDAAAKSWKGFISDPDWQAAHKASEVNGKLVAKIESTFMSAMDYSPEIKPAVAGPRVFELRTYTTTPGNLDRLNARFRDHTTKLFAKHGMTNLFYWKLMPDQKNAADTLVYLLAHKDAAAMKGSFDAFRKDPDWTKAREASEKAAGGSLTAKDGVVSLLMTATDYSQTR
jgi:NIPSNAP